MCTTVCVHTSFRSAEGQFSDVIAQKTKAERAKVLLKARLTAVTKGNSESGETRSASADRAARSQASDSCASGHGCARCSGLDPGTTLPARKQGTQRGGGTAGVGVREPRHAGNGEERERPLRDCAESSLSASSAQQQQQPWRKQEQEVHLDLEPALISEDSGLAGRQQGERFDEPPGRKDDDPKKTSPQQSKGREGWRQEFEPGVQQEPKGTLVEDREKAEPEPQQEVERERREFEAERQRLERERQESSEAVQHAETRVREVEAAWQALAQKAVALAERNADLEWVRKRVMVRLTRRQLQPLTAVEEPCSWGGKDSG